MANCPVCALPIAKTSTGISVGDKSYHFKCITTLHCDNCGRTVGYLAKGTLEGRLRIIYCSTCGKEF